MNSTQNQEIQAFSNCKNISSLVIAIDGTASSGKGTLAKLLAKHFNFPYLNTGGLYRYVAKQMIEQNILLQEFENNISSLTAKIKAEELDDPQLMSEEIGCLASEIAKNRLFRQSLLTFQHNFISQSCENHGGCVLDGRDTTTVICPKADFKFFVSAKIEVRAKRRQMQLKSDDYLAILEALKKRDDNDFNRKESPLKIASDAFLIDNSELSIQQSLDLAINFISQNQIKSISNQN